MTKVLTYDSLIVLRDELQPLTSEGNAVTTLEDWKWWILDSIVGNNSGDETVESSVIEHAYWVAESVWDFDPVTMQAVAEVRELINDMK